MGRRVSWILGAALLTAILATPAAAQVSVSVGVGVPPVAAGVVIGAPPVYAYPAYPYPYAYPYPNAYPHPYYYGYPVYGRVYYGPRYYGARYYGPRTPYYYRGGAPYYGGRAPYYRGPVYRGNVQVSPGNQGRNVRYASGSSRGNGRR